MVSYSGTTKAFSSFLLRVYFAPVTLPSRHTFTAFSDLGPNCMHDLLKEGMYTSTGYLSGTQICCPGCVTPLSWGSFPCSHLFAGNRTISTKEYTARGDEGRREYDLLMRAKLEKEQVLRIHWIFGDGQVWGRIGDGLVRPLAKRVFLTVSCSIVHQT